MSKVVAAISNAADQIFAGHGNGVHKVSMMQKADPWPVTFAQRAPTSDHEKVHRGHCVCGAVGIEVDRGELCNIQQICHCEDCRRWHSAPMVAELLFKAVNGTSRVYLVKGAESVKFVETSKNNRRAMCSECGTRIVNLPAKMEVCATFPSMLPDFPVNISQHVFYKEATHKVHDGIKKYLDAPKEMGGSGELAPQPF